MLIISYNNIITSFTNSYIAVSTCMALWKLYNILWTKGKHICLNTDLIFILYIKWWKNMY